MIPVQRAAVNPQYRRIVIVAGSQMGKTDSLMNVIGQRLDDDPAPILYVGPTRSNVEKVIEPRIIKMMRSASSLWEKLSKGKLNTKTHKTVSGVSLRLGWAGSPTELASQEAALALVDEIDRMESDVGNEGSPLALAEARTDTYPDGKSIVTSTPTEGNVGTIKMETGLTHWEQSEAEDVTSSIWKLWQDGTRFEWAWPCPDCGEYFIPRFELLKWPEHATPQIALRDARLACPHCGVLIHDNRKNEMNARGVYAAPGQTIKPDGTVEGDVEPNETCSFWVSGLCSPFRSWGQRASAFIEAARSGDPGRIKAVINTRFGELYKVGGDAPPWEQVRDLIKPYSATVPPDGVQLVTAYVDVQKDRLIWSIRGWGYSLESWGLGTGEIWGETEHDHVWTELANLRELQLGGHRIRMMGIDSGYRPGSKFRKPDNQIYTFCRRFMGWAVPTKGHDHQEKPLKPARIDVTLQGKTYKGGLQLWHLDSDYFKGFVHSRLSWPDDQPGGWHLPEGTQDDYCQQITAEARVVKPSGRAVWIRIRRENHLLDTEAGNVAMAHILQAQHLKRPPPKPQSPAPVTTAQQKSSWVKPGGGTAQSRKGWMKR